MTGTRGFTRSPPLTRVAREGRGRFKRGRTGTSIADAKSPPRDESSITACYY